MKTPGLLLLPLAAAPPQRCRSRSCPTPRDRERSRAGRAANESLFLHIYVTLAYLSLHRSGAKSFRPTGFLSYAKGDTWAAASGGPGSRPGTAGASPGRAAGARSAAGRAGAALPGRPCARRDGRAAVPPPIAASAWLLLALPAGARPWGGCRLLAEGKCKSRYGLGDVWN